jgi:DNA-binding NarL/FixJ family response regulator
LKKLGFAKNDANFGDTLRCPRQISPNSKILFFSENRSVAIVEEAMRCGARGFVLKSDAANELLPAIRSVFAGHQLVSTGLAHHGLEELAHNAPQCQSRTVAMFNRQLDTEV